MWAWGWGSEDAEDESPSAKNPVRTKSLLLVSAEGGNNIGLHA